MPLHKRTDFLGEEGRRRHLKEVTYTFLLQNGQSTIPMLAKELDLSIPTTTKLVEEYMKEGFILSMGKVETAGGRHPVAYGLNPDRCFFMGVDLKYKSLSIGIVNLVGDWVKVERELPFTFEDTPECLETICLTIQGFLKEVPVDTRKLVAITMTIPGRVNPENGVSHSHFCFTEEPLGLYLTRRIGFPTFIENDTRAMTYGEFNCGAAAQKKNVLFVNMSWGLGMGIIINGELYGGKSGFAGEIGHFPAFDNEIICHCGKKGCLETEASGRAVYRKLQERLERGENSHLLKKFPTQFTDITLADVLQAVKDEDVLSIELIEEVGYALGKEMAGFINVFNPEMVVIGGTLSTTGAYLLEPVRSAIRKHSLNMVNRDSEIVSSTLGDDAGLMGACLLSRYHAVY